MDSLAKSLSDATRIVRQFVSGQSSATQFVERYSNFYYYEALDGHELSSATSERAKHWIAIELHRQIQTEVVNRMALDSSYTKELLVESGRIDETEAREQARIICAERGLDAIFELLGE
jgi:hypothetical protein